MLFVPKVFQWIYPFLPFQFGMKAFKECIAGMYGVDYWINVGKMVLFLIIFVFTMVQKVIQRKWVYQ